MNFRELTDNNQIIEICIPHVKGGSFSRVIWFTGTGNLFTNKNGFGESRQQFLLTKLVRGMLLVKLEGDIIIPVSFTGTLPINLSSSLFSEPILF